MSKFFYFLLFYVFFINTSFANTWSEEIYTAKENLNLISRIFSVENAINFIFAIVVIVWTIIFSKLVDSKIRKYIEKSGDWNNREELVWVLTRTSNITILAIWFTIVLWILWVNMAIFMWGLGFGIWFTMKIFLSNFIAWIIMVTQWSYHNWDLIKVEWQMWVIRKINSLFTKVEQFNWVIFFVPNVKFLENNVENYHTNSKRRVEIFIWVDYETDIIKAKKIIMQVLSNFPNILKAPNPEVVINNFENSSINIEIRFWIDSKWEFFETKSNVTETINLAFKQSWIIIPFPQLTISNRSDFKIA